MQCNQYRHQGDNYIPKYPRLMKAFKVTFFLFCAMVVLAIMVKASHEPDFVKEADAVEEVKPMTLEDSIEKIKVKTVHKLAAECETKGSNDPNSEIIFDSNHVASVGRYQWQLKSVQHWVKVLYKKDITRSEALLIAMDKGSISLDELTTKVMFEVKDGHKEWFNCSNKLGLGAEVNVINQLGK